MAKQLETRISYKYDYEENWTKNAGNKIPLKGELIGYKPDEQHPDYSRLKIGDGVHTVDELLFVDVGSVENTKEYLEDISQKGELYYKGLNISQQPEWNNYDSSKVMWGGKVSADIAGSFEAKFTPREGYLWQNGSTETRSVYWEILKATPRLELSEYSLTLGYEEATVECTYDAPEPLEFHIEYDENKCSVTITDKTETTFNIKITALTKMNNEPITIHSAETDNIEKTTATLYVNSSVLSNNLDDCTWEEISQAAEDGIASSLWEVGQCKKIILNGSVSTLDFNNFECYTYIIGFDHGNEHGGLTGTSKNTIDFQLFAKSADFTNNSTCCFIDDYYKNTGAMGSFALHPNFYEDALNRDDYVFYEDSSIRRVINSDIFNLLQEELKNVLIPLRCCAHNKYCRTYFEEENPETGGFDVISQDSGSSISWIEDKLVIPSPEELLGGDSITSQQYEFYKNNSCIKTAFNSTNKVIYLTRSTECVIDTVGNYLYFNVYLSATAINETGVLDNNNSAEISYGICPIFRVGQSYNPV